MAGLEPTEKVQKPQSTDYPLLLGGNSWVGYCEGHRFNSITNQLGIGALYSQQGRCKSHKAQITHCYWVGIGCGIVRVTGLTVSRINRVLARFRANREGAKATEHRLPTAVG